MSSKKFYVYELWNPIKNEIFYVGKSQYQKYCKRLNDHLQEARAVVNKMRRGNHKIYTIIKILNEGYNIDFRIVYETDNEQEAFAKEIELIKFYGRRSDNTGVLTNLTVGGEGVCGYKVPQWLRDLRRIRNTGKGNPMYGKNHTDKACQQISKVRKERIAIGEIIPTKHTEEWKEHLRTENAGGKATARAVHQIDGNGNIIATFDSLQQAALTVSGKKEAKSNIQSSMVGKNRTIMPYGYFWRYVDEYNSNENFAILSARVTQHKIGKKLYQYDMNSVLINIWDSISAACNALHIVPSMISWAIKNNKCHKNYLWKLE